MSQIQHFKDVIAGSTQTARAWTIPDFAIWLTEIQSIRSVLHVLLQAECLPGNQGSPDSQLCVSDTLLHQV